MEGVEMKRAAKYKWLAELRERDEMLHLDEC